MSLDDLIADDWRGLPREVRLLRFHDAYRARVQPGALFTTVFALRSDPWDPPVGSTHKADCATCGAGLWVDPDTAAEVARGHVVICRGCGEIHDMLTVDKPSKTIEIVYRPPLG